MRSAVLAVMLWFVCAPLGAAIEAYEFDSPEMEAEYKQLIDELRCLVCQNQNLSGSDADLAKDLRRQTYEMLSDGKSREQVIDFMVQRYGDFVLYRPQFKSSTYLLWLGPFLLLAGILIFVVLRLRRAGNEGGVDAASLAEARELLEREDSRQ